MPKLATNHAREAEKAADESEERSFDVVPEGVYVGRLFEVEVSDKEGDSGFHYWIWKFKLEKEGYQGKEARFFTSLSPKAAFSIGGAFKAFGVPADTHTDELLNRRAKLQISQAVIEKGSRKGQIGNNVDNLLPFADGDERTPLDKEDF